MVAGAADRAFAVRQAEAMPVPTLLIETPASPTPDARDLAGHFAQATLEHLDARGPGRAAQHRAVMVGDEPMTTSGVDDRLVSGRTGVMRFEFA